MTLSPVCSTQNKKRCMLSVSTLSPHLFQLERNKKEKDWVRMGIHLITQEVFGSGNKLRTSLHITKTLSEHCVCFGSYAGSKHTMWRAASHTQMVSRVFQWHNRFGKSQNCCYPSHLAGRPIKVRTDASQPSVSGWMNIYQYNRSYPCFRGKFAPLSVCEGK